MNETRFDRVYSSLVILTAVIGISWMITVFIDVLPGVVFLICGIAIALAPTEQKKKRIEDL